MPDAFIDFVTLAGSLCFGIVIGWVTYGTLRRTKRSGLSDISTVIGAVAGAAVTGLFPGKTGAFGVYCIGLAIGFFAYLKSATKPNAPDWLGEAPGESGSGRSGLEQKSGLPGSR